MWQPREMRWVRRRVVALRAARSLVAFWAIVFGGVRGPGKKGGWEWELGEDEGGWEWELERRKEDGGFGGTRDFGELFGRWVEAQSCMVVACIKNVMRSGIHGQYN